MEVIIKVLEAHRVTTNPCPCLDYVRVVYGRPRRREPDSCNESKKLRVRDILRRLLRVTNTPSLLYVTCLPGLNRP